MSIFSSLYIGMSGMRSHEGAIGVIGNNIANLNTIGFKASRAVFADMLSQSVLGTAGMSQQGLGAAVAAVQRLVGQGALLGTNVTTDIAINGDGLFIVENPTGERLYTRNGQFQVDQEGYLTTVEGFRMQGYPADGTGAIATSLGALRIGDATAPPQATTSVEMTVNLDAGAPITGPFDPNDPAGTSSFSTTVTVYDSRGTAHSLEVYFSQTATGQWEWNAVAPLGELDGSTDTTPTIVASGTMTFGTDGTLASSTQTQTTVTFFGADQQDLVFDFGAPGAAGEGSTSFGSASALSFVEQDGFGPGTLAFIEIEQDGDVMGTFSNGQERVLGQVALARFQAPAELNALGQNLFSETIGSGEPAIGQPGTGGRGALHAGSLEQSNVDLTNEFTQLILAQRGFQAASRTITTADEMLVETVNLKR
ncbi:MAG: flagellar hook protein FlgE [Deltaproteobacteria bacterium]|nr:flagellar hook protein FlgE [Deltaproteobacteria bacterium]